MNYKKLPLRNAYDFIQICVHKRHLKQRRGFTGELMVLALGPLGNIALAMRMDPEFINNVNDIIIMGGNFTGKGSVHIRMYDAIPATYVEINHYTSVFLRQELY